MCLPNMVDSYFRRDCWEFQKDNVVDTELFEADIISQARRMADFYVLYYSLENTIRHLISGRLQEQ